MAKSFRIEQSIGRNLKDFNPRARKAIHATMEFQAAKSEGRMRTTAPWTDRTTNARNGLFAQVLGTPVSDAWTLLLSHTVSYGIWLEVIQNGKYAAVRPELLKANREIMKRLSRLLERMEKGKKK